MTTDRLAEIKSKRNDSIELFADDADWLIAEVERLKDEVEANLYCVKQFTTEIVHLRAKVKQLEEITDKTFDAGSGCGFAKGLARAKKIAEDHQCDNYGGEECGCSFMIAESILVTMRQDP